MALVDVDSWLTEFQSCNRLSKTLLSQLDQRSNKPHLSPEYNRYTVAIDVGIKQFDRELQQLKFKLNEAIKNKTVALEETERRQQQLYALQTQREEMKHKYLDSSLIDRDALLQSSSAHRANISEGNGAAPIIDRHDLQAIKQQQIDMLEQQNRGLETLSETLSRHRQIATQLGQEVGDQNDILDNLANTIEKVEAGVSQETRNVGLINRRESTWGYWLIIFILLAVIIIVAVL